MTTDAPHDRAPVSARIRFARGKAGLTLQDVADVAGLTEHQCEDLEAFDDDAFMSVSLRSICSVAEAVGQPPDVLLAPSGLASRHAVTMEHLISEIIACMRASSESEEAFYERVGWDMSSAVRDPATAWSTWNVDCLQDASKSVGIHWLDVLAAWPGRRAV
jgi:transcriptional regulator with XRE-family HTH domain